MPYLILAHFVSIRMIIILRPLLINLLLRPKQLEQIDKALPPAPLSKEKVVHVEAEHGDAELEGEAGPAFVAFLGHKCPEN
jgi:hypothetical protein